VSFFASVALQPVATHAQATHPANAWQPRGIRPTDDTFETALAKLRSETADAGYPTVERIDRYQLDQGDVHVYAVARIRGDDYAIAATIDPSTIVFGRHGGERWRATAGGTVHLIRVDVQGDYLDRWPVAALGFEAGDCFLAGVAHLPKPAWVIEDRPALETPHWLYVDQATGDIVREISREGGRTETFDFDDFRGEPGARRAYRWKVSGPGGDAEYSLTSSTPAPVSEADVAVPQQAAPEFPAVAAPRQLSAVIGKYVTTVKVRVDGRERLFALDSGTPELLFSDAMSRATGPIALGHGVAETLDVDGQVAHDAPFQDVDFALDGLLGFDFFRGRIVHIDYQTHRVEVLPRDGFVPPAGTLALPTDWSEGMPIVTARIGNAQGSRFVLDTGSRHMVLRDAFVKRAGPAAGIEVEDESATTIRYLEGPFLVKAGHVAAFTLGNVKIDGAGTYLEIPNSENMDFPLDGILGTDELNPFEWWFDADGTTTWFRPY
jgi:hypothetical protein